MAERGANEIPEGRNEPSSPSERESLTLFVCYHICSTTSATNFNKAVELMINVGSPFNLAVAGALRLECRVFIST
jgi:hypothetical protein